MKNFNYFLSSAFLTFALVLLLSGCASMPAADTMNKRMALIEITYGEILDTANLYKDENRLTQKQKDELTDLFNNIDKIKATAYTAIELKDQGRFDTSAQVLSALLQTVRTILTEVK